jgi:hypothetical protein
MSNKKIAKKTVDIPSDLFEKIMTYSHENKIYKFSPAVIQLIEIALKSLEEGDG